TDLGSAACGHSLLPEQVPFVHHHLRHLRHDSDFSLVGVSIVAGDTARGNGDSPSASLAPTPLSTTALHRRSLRRWCAGIACAMEHMAYPYARPPSRRTVHVSESASRRTRQRAPCPETAGLCRQYPARRHRTMGH